MFNSILSDVEDEEGYALIPYGKKNLNDNWFNGLISISFLQNNYGEFETVEEMKNATESEGLKLYFDWLKSEGILT